MVRGALADMLREAEDLETSTNVTLKDHDVHSFVDKCPALVQTCDFLRFGIGKLEVLK